MLGLVLAWGASALARRPPTKRYTYGLRSTSILAALGGKVAQLFAAATRTLKLLLCNSFRKILRFRIKKVVMTGPNTVAIAVLIKPVEFL